MKYVFGVMSSKWELESSDFSTALVAMALKVNSNVPIAVYDPIELGVVMPSDILKNHGYKIHPNYLKEVLLSIKEAF